MKGRCVPAAFVSVGLVAAQSIGPDEIHTQAFAYVPPSAVTLSTQVRLVDVPVVVRDAQRHAVAGLTRDDFEIYDAGKKRTISAFSTQSFAAAGAADMGAAPRSETATRFVALVLDNLHIDAVALKAAKDAAVRFVQTSLAPGDRVVVATTSDSGNHEFTADVPKLIAEIAKVISHQKNNAGVCPAFQNREAYLVANDLDPQLLQRKVAECYACSHTPCPKEQVTALALGLWEPALSDSRSTLGVINDLVGSMAKAPGQRVIVLTSEELLTGEVEADIDRLTTKALHANVVINALDAKRLTVTSQEEKNDAMAALASGTGGAFYHNNNDLLQGFREIGMAPETMYVLSFTSPEESADGRFHALKVQLASGKRYSVQARLGYMPLPVKPAAQEPTPSKLDSEVAATDTIADLPVRFTWEQRAGAPNATMVIHMDVSRLHFERKKDRRTQKLTIVAMLSDSSGGFVTGQRIEFDLNLTDATYAQLAKTDFSAALPMKVAVGSYEARAVALDAVEGKMTAAIEAVQVK
jgi:VWFA-related protein